jgi:threonine dehydrogenase-like Zn-dependent dehydrogenase
MEITGQDSDVVVEAAGTTKTVEQTPALVRKAGRVALVGEFEGNMNFGDADEACFFTTYISPLEYPTAVDLVARKETGRAKPNHAQVQAGKLRGSNSNRS